MIRALLFIFLALPLASQIPGWSPVELARIAPRPAEGASYTPYTAVFDSSDYLAVTNSGLTGFSDAKTFTFNLWVKPSAGDGAQRVLFVCANTSASTRFQISLHTDNTVRIFGRNGASVTILDMRGSTAITSSSGWTWIYICVNLANSSERKIYINGVADTLTVTTYTDDTLDLNAGGSSRYRVAASAAAADLFSGSMTELWIDDTYSDTPELFASGGKPIAPPAGAAVYLSLNGSGNSWATDSSGNGNNFVVNGTLGTDTPP